MLNKVTSTMVDGGGQGAGEQVKNLITTKSQDLRYWRQNKLIVQARTLDHDDREWPSEKLFEHFHIFFRWTWMSWTSRWSRSRRCLWRSRRWWRRWAAPPPPTRLSWRPRYFFQRALLQSYLFQKSHMSRKRCFYWSAHSMVKLKSCFPAPAYCHMLIC